LEFVWASANASQFGGRTKWNGVLRQPPQLWCAANKTFSFFGRKGDAQCLPLPCYHTTHYVTWDYAKSRVLSFSNRRCLCTDEFQLKHSFLFRRMVTEAGMVTTEVHVRSGHLLISVLNLAQLWCACTSPFLWGGIDNDVPSDEFAKRTSSLICTCPQLCLAESLSRVYQISAFWIQEESRRWWQLSRLAEWPHNLSNTQSQRLYNSSFHLHVCSIALAKGTAVKMKDSVDDSGLHNSLVPLTS
jgi:hypothetical protein